MNMLPKFVFLCVVYTLLIKLTRQIPLNAQVNEAVNSPKHISNALKQQNADQSEAPSTKRTKRPSTTVYYTVPQDKRRELVKAYFPYTFKPQYEEFYEWFYKVLTDEKRKQERISRGMAMSTLHVDYDGIVAKAKYSIPSYHRSWYAYVDEMERLFNITTAVFYTGNPDPDFYGASVKLPPTRLR